MRRYDNHSKKLAYRACDDKKHKWILLGKNYIAAKTVVTDGVHRIADVYKREFITLIDISVQTKNFEVYKCRAHNFDVNKCILYCYECIKTKQK